VTASAEEGTTPTVPQFADADGAAGGAADGRRGQRTARRAGRRKIAVLEAACRVIASRGAEATRFADVADASGVPVSTLQYYFGSREDLLVAAFRHASATELEALGRELDQVGSAWQRISIVVRRALAGYQPGSSESGLLWIESWHFAIRDAEMRLDALRDYAGWRRLVADAVRLGVANGEFAPAVSPEQAATLTIAMTDGAGIPLALGDPALTVADATAGVLATVASLLRADAAGESGPAR
jgi:AcrR family transcriptional regulator